MNSSGGGGGGEGAAGQGFIADTVNSDVRAIISNEMNGAVTSFVTNLLAYGVVRMGDPDASMSSIRAELERVFPREWDASNAFSSSSDNLEVMGDTVDVLGKRFIDTVSGDDDVINGNIDVPKVLYIVKRMCTSLFQAQFGAHYYDTPLHGNLSSAAKESMDDTLEFFLDEFINKKIPYKRDEGDYVDNLAEFLTRTRALIDDKEVPPNRREVKNLVFNMFLPWFVFKFVASFVPGEWNAEGTNFNTAYHNVRLAELALYRMLFDVTYRLKAALEATEKMPEDKSAFFQQIGFCIVNSVQKRFIDPASSSYPDMNNDVVQLSRDTKDTSEEMHRLSALFERRRENLEVMLHNQRVLEQQLTWKRRVYWIMVGVYVTILVGFLLLLFFGMYNALYVGTGTVMVALLLWYAIHTTKTLLKKENK